MPNCPRCQQPVKPQAITCPYCRETLKAHGHPGIPLHRATGEDYLCDSCTYHADDTCNFPQRPFAKQCTLYHDRFQPEPEIKKQPNTSQSLRLWVEKNMVWLLIAGLFLISLLISLSR